MILIFILSAVSVVVWTIFIESKEDVCIIEESKSGSEQKWKLYSAVTAGLIISLVTALVTIVTGSLYSLLLFPILSIIYSIVHDCSMSYRLTGKLFELGRGRWDTKVKEIFQNGKLWFLFKTIWLILISGTYFSLNKSNK